ncbi:hypothetical protein [Leuconostoc gasicomitatum]|uniref:hypothetical protein n=1 Tax=Leuconostoc gasicomitatum TaxID=115778 RepID=UPI001CC7E727|nr:hypothetical protein [Leuconostoc gasicomitatum]MBZ5971575.1 hypothetical protein [Leuconostoc gasicomitatum]
MITRTTNNGTQMTKYQNGTELSLEQMLNNAYHDDKQRDIDAQVLKEIDEQVFFGADTPIDETPDVESDEYIYS